MDENDEYFPRGGKQPTAPTFTKGQNFLGASQKVVKKKKRPQKKTEADDGYLSDEIVAFKACAVGIHYSTIKPGVLVLGRVQRVLETKVTVMLPCRLVGTVMACHISEPYNKMMDDYVKDKVDSLIPLEKMFRPGQYVAVKVLEVFKDSLMLSMMPQDINASKNHTDLYHGALLQAAVSSVEDHGYVMDIGIPNTRVFMSEAAANPEIELERGMLVWCCVKNLERAPASAVVKVSGALERLRGAAQARPSPRAALLPGTAVIFTVSKPLENGIEGHIFQDTTAFIQRYHAGTVKGKKPTLGQKFRARVLYVMPTTDTPFLTMHEIFETSYPDLQQEMKLQEGDIVEDAKVLKITGKSIHFRLCEGALGIMSIRRVRVDEDLTDEEVIAKSYPIGSAHTVRVLTYHLSDYAYSVSDERAVLAERYFRAEQLRAGDAVDAAVHAVGAARLVLRVGRLTGVVPHTHLSDAGVCVDPKKPSASQITSKYKVGQAVRARVLSVEPARGSLYLTLKPSLLAPGLEPLADYEQACVGKAYTGTIRYVQDYVLVMFFAGLMAYVPRQYVTREPLESLTDAFHLGQIVNCTILKVDPEAKKMMGSLVTTPFWPEKKREITYENNKRKHTEEDAEVRPDKKQKLHDEVQSRDDTKEGEEDKENDDDSDEIADEEGQSRKKGRKKRRKKNKNTKVPDSEQQEEENVEDKSIEEGAEQNGDMEVDGYEDNINILEPQDMGLIDMSDCVTEKQWKKRMVSLSKSIKARSHRIDRIEKKIANIEENGLSVKNKKFHTAMHKEKIIIQERIKKLLEALSIAQTKVKEFKAEQTKNIKNKNKKVKEVKEEKSTNKTKSVSDKVEKKVEKKSENEDESAVSRLEVKVLDSLEPALEVPAAKEFWFGAAGAAPTAAQPEESSSSDEDVAEQPRKKRKKLSAAEKVARDRAEEERLRALELRAAEAGAAPRSSEQFERALLAEPNCSQLWIAYMAFHLQATEVEKARAVGRRALNTINFREEQEKLNVWLALINCEIRFGTTESQEKIVEEAVQMNDAYSVHCRVLDMYADTGKHHELAALADRMLRKHRKQPGMFEACARALYRLGLVTKARRFMEKALLCLDKSKHVSLLTQFALMEQACGERERARALLDGVLAQYPERVDVCCVYADMLLKDRDVEAARQLMENMTSKGMMEKHKKLTARKMKSLYRKWIEIEEKFGDPSRVETLKQRAVEFIKNAKY